ncbi:hypothetical protein BJ508DRAFT_190297, partial [Ascobolus immersus RN42]
LAKMALEVLTGMVMSAEPERVFNGIKLLITQQRCALKDEVIEANECLKAWW